MTLCGRYLGDNDATCPQLTCTRAKDHASACDNTVGACPTVVHIKSAAGRGALYIGRACYGMAASIWQNPIKLPKGYDIDADPENILGRYEEIVRRSSLLMNAIRSGELDGRVLGCWCKSKLPREHWLADRPCHGDMLVKLWREVRL